MTLPLIIASSFLITLVLVPVVIRVFKSLNLLDIPDERKIHLVKTPSLGGLAIYSGVFLSFLFAFSLIELSQIKFFVFSSFIIFLLGIRDDISSLQAKHKLVLQIFSGVLVIYFGGVKIEGLGGLFGIDSFPYFFDELFTLFVIVVMTNSYNLIDGIDGLAGSIGLVISLFFAWVFITMGYRVDAGISLAIAGGLLGFLLFNWYPSKIFMGDTGSMTTGFMLTVLLIKFISIPGLHEIDIVAPVALGISLFIVPFYDTLRVFTIRSFQGKHPLAPDNNHIHHILLKLGLNHAQATSILVGYMILAISQALFFQGIGDTLLLSILLAQTTLLGLGLDYRLIRVRSSLDQETVPGKIKLSKSA